MNRIFRNLTLGATATVIAVFGVTSVASYRPSGATDRALSINALKRALASLDADTLDSAARLATYRDGLRETDALLRRAIGSNPTDTASIERLAMVRWESGVLAGASDVDTVTSLIAVAARRAPRVPEIQADLGDLLCKMGRPDDAVPFMARALTLSTSMTNRVVTTMTNAGLMPDRIADRLPQLPTILIALKEQFLAAGQGAEFLDRVELVLVDASPALLASYGEACLQLRVPERLKDQLAKLASVPDRSTMAERTRQAGHAAFALGELRGALAFADSARTLMPDDPSYDEFFGEVALASGRASDAANAFRSALSSTVRLHGPASVRARLYREIGQAVESEGRGDLAVDAYRRALGLDAAEPYALARLAALNAAVTGTNSK